MVKSRSSVKTPTGGSLDRHIGKLVCPCRDFCVYKNTDWITRFAIKSMDILLLITVILLVLILKDIRKILHKEDSLPLQYTPSKESSMDMHSDMSALYYTDVQYPVYGKEIIRLKNQEYRNQSYKAYSLAHALTQDSNKKKDHLYAVVLSRLLEQTIQIMMQANLDVLNGKIDIETARHKTEFILREKNHSLPPMIWSQIRSDAEDGIDRSVEEYLNYEKLHTLRNSGASTKDTRTADE